MLGEGDGRCVRALGPASVGHAAPHLLLNPPSVSGFNNTSVFACD